jgi:hypothetical protein
LPAPSIGRKPTVALALGAGGAKGLAHIGVIREIEAQGYEIVAIAGSSMGALIGGIHAMGKLDVYSDWVCALAKLDVLRLVDWTFSGGGLIKGEKIIETLRTLVGDTLIEELPLAFTAVATDLDRGREVWLGRGSLFDAIRASISWITPMCASPFAPPAPSASATVGLRPMEGAGKASVMGLPMASIITIRWHRPVLKSMHSGTGKVFVS